MTKADNDRRYREKKRADPDRYAKQLEYGQAYYRANRARGRWSAYNRQDRAKALLGVTLSWAEAEPLMKKPCFYCAKQDSCGLDRRDSSIAHTLENVVPCCENCNLILSDMPPALKDIFIPSLTEARERGLLDSWLHPRLRSSLAPRAS